MRRELLLASGLTLCAIISPLEASAQWSTDDALQTQVVAAVAKSLGADPEQIPNYNDELKQARREADAATICGNSSVPQFLNEAVATKVFKNTLFLLKKNDVSVSERPRYVADLIITSAASFEAGRLAASTDEYRASLCD